MGMGGRLHLDFSPRELYDKEVCEARMGGKGERINSRSPTSHFLTKDYSDLNY